MLRKHRTKEKRRFAVLLMTMAVLLASPPSIRAQGTDVYFESQGFGSGYAYGFSHEGFGNDYTGNFGHQGFGAPLGSGVFILLAAGTCYAVKRRQKSGDRRQNP